MSGSFEKVQKNFGFGYMRLPMKGEDVDIPQTTAMVDAFLENGFNYFDTAHGYINGKSELAIRECLSSRYPRERYILTNKLSANYFEKEEDIRPLFQQQLEACGVEYFDFYLWMACQNLIQNFRGIVEGDPKMMDLTFLFQFQCNLKSPGTFVLSHPGGTERMHQIEVKVFYTAGLQLLLEQRPYVFFLLKVIPGIPVNGTF